MKKQIGARASNYLHSAPQTMLRYFLVIFFLLAAIGVRAQNIAINADGSLPNPNAMLDIKSANKGLLIPRMSTEARLRIPHTQGLMVYDTNTNSFWYNTGKMWKSLTATAAESLSATGAWMVTGNAGTDETNFLGTIDNVPLNIRVNNQSSGRIDPILRNTFLGFRSGYSITTGNDNTAIGSSAMFAITSGFNNTAVGADALQNNSTGFHNAAFGRFALMLNTTGFNNTAHGTGALFSNTTGDENTATGANSMQLNETGTLNTAAGSKSLYTNRTGIWNTAIGASAVYFNQTGNFNTALGTLSLSNNAIGSFNTAIGIRALILNSDGNYNTALGAQTATSGSTMNATAIGYGAFSDASNKVRIGNSAVTVIEGAVPFTFPSDGRFKFQVQEDVKGLDFILQLRPVTYRFDTKRFDQTVFAEAERQSEKKNPLSDEGKYDQNKNTGAVMDAAYDAASSIRRSGFIAQEVEQAAIKTGYNFSGIITPNKEQHHYSLSYDAFVVPLVKAVQEQQQLIEKQNEKMKAYEKRIDEMQRELDEIKAVLKRSR